MVMAMELESGSEWERVWERAWDCQMVLRMERGLHSSEITSLSLEHELAQMTDLS